MPVMDVTRCYAFTLSAIILLSVLLWLARSTVQQLYIHGARFFLQHVFYSNFIIYPKLLKRYTRIAFGRTTRLEALMILCFIVANVVCTVVDSGKDLMSRAGLLSTINLIPLSLGHHMNFFLRTCGLDARDYGRAHRWIARVAIVQGATHSIIAISAASRADMISQISASAWTSLSALAAIFLSSFIIIRRFWYESFAILHRFLAAAIISAIWVHTFSEDVTSVPTLYLLIATCVWGATRTIWLFGVIYRNLKFGKPVARAVIRQEGFALLVNFQPSRSWDFRPGQFVYLCVPWIAPLQWHPFMIAWWEDDGDDTITLIIEPKAGFTKKLANSRATLSGTALTVLIDGPYGREVNLRKYGTVLLIAHGVGLAAQLLYVRQVLQDYRQSRTSCRRIIWFWEVETYNDYTGAIIFLNSLLDLDNEIGREIAQVNRHDLEKSRLARARNTSFRAFKSNNFETETSCRIIDMRVFLRADRKPDPGEFASHIQFEDRALNKEEIFAAVDGSKGKKAILSTNSSNIRRS